jgi:16S rRNA (adenine1518-N6/adenine1519-N6)-dimethyltransferase
MTLTEMRQLLEHRGIQLTKSLGQNFLHDAHQLQRIADAAGLAPGDRVLEIGPGLGPLTEVLVSRVGQVFAIEKDARLVRVLEERLVQESTAPRPVSGTVRNPAAREGETLAVLHADALEFLKQEPRDWSDWKMVSNLPYSVASPILVELCQGARSPRLMVATLQLEVAQRLMSKPGSRDYGVLTLLVQQDFEPARWFKISAGCFFPQPDVDSACVVLRRRPAMLLPGEARPVFVRLVKRAFSQRRKMMIKLLKQDWETEALEAAYRKLGLSPQVRAESVSLDEFVALTASLLESRGLKRR